MPPQYRILMLNNRYLPAVGGAEMQASQLNAQLQQRGHTVQVITRRLYADWPAQETINDIPVRRLSPVGLSHRANALIVLRMLVYLLQNARQFDVIHVHGIGPLGLAAILAGMLTRRPVILKAPTQGDILRNTGAGSVYSQIVRRFLLPPRLWRFLLNRASRIIALSEGIYKEASDYGLRNMVVVPNGVNIERFDRITRQAARHHLQLDATSPVLLFTGRLVNRKRLDVLLDAFATVLQQYPDSQLLLAGSGHGQSDSAEAALHAQAQRLNIAERVHFLGLRDDVDVLLRAADVYVFPSEREGMPNAVLEAMAARLPVVASRIDGVTDVLDDESGWLVPVGDVQVFSDAILAVLSDPPQAQARSKHACVRVCEHFSLEAVAARYESLYAEITGKASID